MFFFFFQLRVLQNWCCMRAIAESKEADGVSLSVGVDIAFSIGGIYKSVSINSMHGACDNFQ